MGGSPKTAIAPRPSAEEREQLIHRWRLGAASRSGVRTAAQIVGGLGVRVVARTRQRLGGVVPHHPAGPYTIADSNWLWNGALTPPAKFEREKVVGDVLRSTPALADCVRRTGAMSGDRAA